MCILQYLLYYYCISFEYFNIVNFFACFVLSLICNSEMKEIRSLSNIKIALQDLAFNDKFDQ